MWFRALQVVSTSMHSGTVPIKAARATVYGSVYFGMRLASTRCHTMTIRSNRSVTTRVRILLIKKCADCHML